MALYTNIQRKALRMAKNSLYSGCTLYQAPEVDGITYVHSNHLKTGCFTDVRIRETLEYDLIGDTV